MSIIPQLKFFLRKKKSPGNFSTTIFPLCLSGRNVKEWIPDFGPLDIISEDFFSLLVPNYSVRWRRGGGDTEVSHKKSKQHPKCFHNIRGNLM